MYLTHPVESKQYTTSQQNTSLSSFRTGLHTAQKLKSSIKDFVSNFDQIRRKLRILPNLLEKSVMENFILIFVTSFLWYSKNFFNSISTH